MTDRPIAPAELPPPGIVGLAARWSRLVHTPELDGVGRTWHVLDSWAEREHETAPALTLFCVHGNPSWSFLWRRVIAEVERTQGHRVRVIAMDQLDMGFSERTGRQRTLSTRIDDLCQLSTALRVNGPVITLAHDWGGPISLGWALRHQEQASIGAAPESLDLPVGTAAEARATGASSVVLAGVVLTNTAVQQPSDSSAPAIIRLIRRAPLLKACTVHTSAFIHGAIEMSRPRLPAAVRQGFLAPYRSRQRRFAIADFVSDIPLDPSHESASMLDDIASGLTRLATVPSLLLWGPRDRVFSDRYLHDLERRLPHAEVHRFPKAAHFVTEDADVAGAVVSWLGTLSPTTEAAGTFVETAMPDESVPVSTQRKAQSSPESPGRPLSDFSIANADSVAIVESGPGARSISFAELGEHVLHLAAGMSAFGIRQGDRVAVMVLPGIDLSLVVYGCWRLGATLVLVDSGLGPRGMQQALKSANPDWLIGIDKALSVATALGWPGRRIATGSRSSWVVQALSIETDLTSLMARGAASPTTVSMPKADTVAAIAFTSGSTGPSKGVIYRHAQIQAQRDALMRLYDIEPDDRLVAAFAPFALYGPTMGIRSIVPEMNVAAPGTLSAMALAQAAKTVEATLVFASPAALVNVMKTQQRLTPSEREALSKVRLVLSAGAPVRAALLQSVKALFKRAACHTPYGMTEVLPVADISLDTLTSPGVASEIDAGQEYQTVVMDDGVCVGHPLPAIEVHIDPLDDEGQPLGAPSAVTRTLGEIVVKATHARQGYDRLWHTEHQASQPPGWHRTGDIGGLDEQGRLWVGGRLGHVITTASGPLAPVAIEQALESIDEVDLAAVVGVGPTGCQVVVAVLQGRFKARSPHGATLALIDQVRAAAATTADIVAVLTLDRLPVDRRHNSKIDRSAIALWASAVLAGQKAVSP